MTERSEVQMTQSVTGTQCRPVTPAPGGCAQ
jgi:hypothetical protein